jgi:hypothetical protein
MSPSPYIKPSLKGDTKGELNINFVRGTHELRGKHLHFMEFDWNKFDWRQFCSYAKSLNAGQYMIDRTKRKEMK